jgi:hypothetical protein
MSNDVNYDLITVEQARKILGEKADQMSDEQITDLLNLLRLHCDKQIESAIRKNHPESELSLND